MLYARGDPPPCLALLPIPQPGHARMSSFGSGNGGARFSALDTDVEVGGKGDGATLLSPPSGGKLSGRLSSVSFLQKAVAALALVSLALVISLGVALSSSSSSSSTITPNGPVNPDPPGTLPGSVQVVNIMATLKDLQDVAKANGGSRCVCVVIPLMHATGRGEGEDVRVGAAALACVGIGTLARGRICVSVAV